MSAAAMMSVSDLRSECEVAENGRHDQEDPSHTKQQDEPELDPLRFPFLLGGPMAHSLSELVVVHGEPPLTRMGHGLAQTGHDPGEIRILPARAAKMPVLTLVVTMRAAYFCTHWDNHRYLGCESSRI